ncbi:MAG: hypothetical protein H6559_00285 [Lewinellaceae bacterium]|nr:hypothetical protein [Lewinellaceae bacterium]
MYSNDKPISTKNKPSGQVGRRSFLGASLSFFMCYPLLGTPFFTRPTGRIFHLLESFGDPEKRPRIVVNKRSNVIHAYRGSTRSIAPQNAMPITNGQLFSFFKSKEDLGPNIEKAGWSVSSGAIPATLQDCRLYKPEHAIKCLALSLIEYKYPESPVFEPHSLDIALDMLSCIKKEKEENYYLFARLACLRYENNPETAFYMLVRRFQNYEKARLNDREEFNKFFHRTVEKESFKYRKRIVGRINNI